MNRLFHGAWQVLFGGLAAIMLSGCAEMPAWVPFQPPRTDDLPGVVTPGQKNAQLRKLRMDAEEVGPEMKSKTVAYLSDWVWREKDSQIRGEIIRTVGEYNIPEASNFLKAALSDLDPDVRIAACHAWGKRNDPNASKYLAETLRSDRDKDVRFAAIRALGNTHDQQAIQALSEMLAEKDPAMQYYAVNSLRNVTGQDLGNDVDKWQQYAKDGKLQPAPIASNPLKKLF